MGLRRRFLDWLPLGLAVWWIASVANIMARRLLHPYDLEWMEGGMLVHAWRISEGLPLYVAPSADWIPMIYPPGYPWLVALVGVDYPLARGLSIAGTALAAACVAWVVARVGRDGLVGICAAALFLGCYPVTGAFFDLVRPDGLAVGFVALAIALSVPNRLGSAVGAGFAVFLAFTFKHNSAAFGVPIALALWVRDPRHALGFVAASVTPALAFVGGLNLTSDGHFLTYLLDVPRSHPVYPNRALPGSALEAGRALPGVWLVAALWLAWRSGLRAPRWARVLLPLGLGVYGGLVGLWSEAPRGIPGIPGYAGPLVFSAIGLASGALLIETGERLWAAGSRRSVWLAMSVSFAGVGWLAVQGVGLLQLEGVYGWLGLGVLLAATALGFAGAVGLALARRARWEWVLGVGLAATALGMACWMRGHHGGFTNVFIPLYLVGCMAFGIAVARARALPVFERAVLSPLSGAGAVLLAGSLASQPGMSSLERLAPTEADRLAGDAVVERLASYPGPVLSPYAPWLAQQAGHDPSFHLIALWDVSQHKTGPYHKRAAIPKAASEHKWATVLDGPRGMQYGISGQGGAYQVAEKLQIPASSLRPKTGWPARPMAILTPKESR